MKRLILHIGPHKTASSYLQKELSDNYEKLKSQKILYPQKWRDFLWGHHSLIKDIRSLSKKKHTDTADVLNFLKVEFEKYDTIILSSENMEYWKEENIEIFSKLSDINIEIVYYVRKISSLVFSSWQEKVKHGSYITFSEYLFTHFSKPFRSDLFNYKNVISKFQSNLPNAKLNLIVYDNLLYKKFDVAKHFFEEILNTTWQQKKEKSAKINASLEAFDIEIIRALNVNFSLNGINPTDKVRNTYLKNFHLYIKELQEIKKSMNTFTKTIRIDDKSFTPKSIYKTFFKYYSDNFMNSAENEIFFDLGSIIHTVVSPDVWFIDKNREHLQNIINKLKQLDQK